MAGYGQEIAATLPTVAGDIDTWGTELNVLLQEIVDTLEAAVTPAGMNINADVDCGGNKLDDVEAVGFDDASTQPAASTANQGILYPFDGELWYHDFSNRRIKITSNGILNASGNGDIGGDFGLGNEAVAFNDTANRYSFTEENGQHSEIEVAAVLFSRDGETNPNEVTLQPPAALAAAYALTLPAALPASTAIPTISNTGVMATTRDPSVDTLTTAGVASIGGVLSALAGAKFKAAGAGSDTLTHLEAASVTEAVSVNGVAQTITGGGSNFIRIGSWVLWTGTVTWTQASTVANVAVLIRNAPYAAAAMDGQDPLVVIGEFGADNLDAVPHVSGFINSTDIGIINAKTRATATFSFTATTAYRLSWLAIYKV